MLNWDELINQMRAVSYELRAETGDVGELGNLIDEWADNIEKEQLVVSKAVRSARSFHPVKATNG